MLIFLDCFILQYYLFCVFFVIFVFFTSKCFIAYFVYDFHMLNK